MNKARHPEHGPIIVKHITEQIIDTARDGTRITLLLHQRLVKFTVITLGEHLINQTHGIIFGSLFFGHFVCDPNSRLIRQLILFYKTFFLFLSWLRNIAKLRNSYGGYIGEIFSDPFFSVSSFKVTYDDYDSVVGRIISLSLIHISEPT